MSASTTDRRPADAAGDRGQPGDPGRPEGRDHFIAVRKTDILAALIDHGRLADAAERDRFRQVCRLLAAIYHYEYFAELERLRDDYYYFNPEIEPHAGFDQAAQERAYEIGRASCRERV